MASSFAKGEKIFVQRPNLEDNDSDDFTIYKKKLKKDHSSNRKRKYPLRSRSSNMTTTKTTDVESNSESDNLDNEQKYSNTLKLQESIIDADLGEGSSFKGKETCTPSKGQILTTIHRKGKYSLRSRSSSMTTTNLGAGEDSVVRGRNIDSRRSKESKQESTDVESNSESDNFDKKQKCSKTVKLQEPIIDPDLEEDSSFKGKETCTPSKQHRKTNDKLDGNDPAYLSSVTSQDLDNRSDDEMSEVFDVLGNDKEIKQAETEINNNVDSVQVENTSAAFDNKKIVEKDSASFDNEKTVKSNNTERLMEEEGASALTPNDTHLQKKMEGNNSNDVPVELKQSKCPSGQFIVMKRVLMIRCRTQATLPQIFFSLFRTNANVNHAIAFLNHKDTTHVWRMKEDKVLIENNVKGMREIIAKRGVEAVQKRRKFLQLC